MNEQVQEVEASAFQALITSIESSYLKKAHRMEVSSRTVQEPGSNCTETDIFVAYNSDDLPVGGAKKLIDKLVLRMDNVSYHFFGSGKRCGVTSAKWRAIRTNLGWDNDRNLTWATAISIMVMYEKKPTVEQMLVAWNYILASDGECITDMIS